MKSLLSCLVALNLLVLYAVATQKSNPEATTAGVLRARAIELVDDKGVVRGSLIVEPNGEAVFRLRDQTGSIRVKIGASQEGAGLLLLDAQTEPGIHLLAKKEGTRLTLAREGRKQQIQP